MPSRRQFLRLGLSCFAAGAAHAAPDGHEGTCTRPIRLPGMQWEPYVYRDDGGRWRGADYELINAVLAEAGCTLAVVADVPRKRRYAMYEAAELDLLPGATDTAERRLHSWFTRPYRQETVALFTLPNKAAALQGLADFDALRRGGVRLLALNSGWFGADYEGLRETLLRERLLTTFETYPQGLQMLLHGRGDVLLADQATLLHEAQGRSVTLAVLPLKALDAPVHLMLNKATVSPATLQRIDAALMRLEAAGTLARLRARYGLG